MGEMTEFNVRKVTIAGRLTVDCRKSLVIQALSTGSLSPMMKLTPKLKQLIRCDNGPVAS